MNDKEKLQYLYEKEKEKEKKQEKKQGQVLFAGGMVGYLIISAFKVVVMSFFPLLFFYFILGIGGMTLIVLSLIAGAVFFYIREGKDIKEEMGNRAMMEEVRNEHSSYIEEESDDSEESEDNMVEDEEKEMADMLENAEEQMRKASLIIENTNDSNQKSLYIQRGVANAFSFALILEASKAIKNTPVVRKYLREHNLKSVEDIPYFRKNFYAPLADDTENLGKLLDKYGFMGAITEEDDKDISEDWERAIEINDDNLLENIFNQVVLEAMKIARRESYSKTVHVLGNLKKYFDYHSEKEWRDHVKNMEEKEEENLKIHKARLLTENEKRGIGLVL